MELKHQIAEHTKISKEKEELSHVPLHLSPCIIYILLCQKNAIKHQHIIISSSNILLAKKIKKQICNFYEQIWKLCETNTSAWASTEASERSISITCKAYCWSSLSGCRYFRRIACNIQFKENKTKIETK